MNRWQTLAATLTVLMCLTAAHSQEPPTPGPEPDAAPEAEAAPQAAPAPEVVIQTSLGDIKVRLFADRAPATVENFLRYVDDGFYDGTIFHRVISTFMIQGGGFTPGMQQKPTRPPVRNEAENGLQNRRGTLAMARTPDPHSATSQFFINVEDNRQLDFRNASPQGFGYCVFGEVVAGMDVVDKIRNVETTTVHPHQNVPARTVEIVSIRRAQAAAPAAAE